MNCNFDGKVAVITGGGRGLGRGFAERLAGGGADIVIADISIPDETVAAIEALGRKCVAVPCDVTRDDQIEQVRQAVVDNFRGCDILINNAATFPVIKYDELTFDQWQHAFDVNIHGMFRMCKALTPGMIERKWGRIINIASIQFWTKVMCGAHYTSSKGAVIGLTRALADELGVHGITVNCIAPGAIGTEAVRRSALGPQLEIAAEARQAIKRVGSADDLSGPVAFFASEFASFVTGQTLAVDGGIIHN